MGIFEISKFKKAGSYLMELLIVVVGVSIAFQLNVWNDDRKSAEAEIHLLQNFISENNLNKDSRHYEPWTGSDTNIQSPSV